MSSSLSLVLLHFFGSTHCEWDLVARRLSEECRIFMLDLPGIGDAASDAPVDVGGMADALIDL